MGLWRQRAFTNDDGNDNDGDNDNDDDNDYDVDDAYNNKDKVNDNNDDDDVDVEIRLWKALYFQMNEFFLILGKSFSFTNAWALS